MGLPPTHALEARVGANLRERGLTISVAESCTGGLLCHTLTNVPGSSAYFLGGVVSYADRLKLEIVGVNAHTLEQYGAVSQEVALEMARGVRSRLGSDLALAVTGIAGPGGGSWEKPVGLTWIALSAPWGEIARRYVWHLDRLGNKQRSVQAALELLLQSLGAPSVSG